MDKMHNKKSFGKSLTLLMDRSPEPKATDGGSSHNNQTYDFLAGLRKVKKLSTQKIQDLYNSYGISNLPDSLFSYGLRISQFSKCEETKLVLEVIRSLKEFILSLEIGESENVSRALSNYIDIFNRVTAEFVEATEGMNTFYKYITTLNNIIRTESTKVKVNWNEAKAWLERMIDKFTADKIIDAEAFIIEYVKVSYLQTVKMIHDDETILVYGYSTLLKNMLVELTTKRKNVNIVYATEIDNKASQDFVSTLTSHGVQITYTTINGVPYFMNKVSKIIVSGITMYSNGSMLGVAGTALVDLEIAAYGANFRKPFYVLCESFKFSDKSKIDGLIVNKGVESIVEEADDTFNRIALTYDLTPQKFISLVVSEIGLIPPSSVSVILREFSIYDSTNMSYKPMPPS